MNLFRQLFFTSIITCAFCTYTQKISFKDYIAGKDPALNLGYCIISPTNADFNFCKHHRRLFTPASNTKLFTAAAAFYFLGYKYVFKTSLLSDAPVHDSAINGNVYIHFSGDPSLTKQDLAGLFGQLKKLSVSCIHGDICLISEIEDNDQAYYAPGFSLDDVGAGYNPPVTGYIVDGNVSLCSHNKNFFSYKSLDHICATIRKLMKKFGIKLTGTIRRASAPSRALRIISCHKSRPLKDLVSHMLKTSDNLYANAFFKHIGKKVCGSEGSWKTGQKAVKNFASQCVGIAPAEWVLDDGAGLSRYNLISPEHIVKLLSWVYRQKEMYPIFIECLPASGIDGTLKNRMIEHRGIVKAKTGTLSGVSALSGYICVPGNEPYIFSIMLNGFIQQNSDTHSFSVNYKSDVEDALCGAVIAEIAAMCEA
jgi:serine-type D-Ala-D-Ala carboxypeptidase/endopeptidase (penicillin-binding protein 4)